MNTPQGKLIAVALCIVALAAVALGWHWVSGINGGPDTARLAGEIKSTRTDIPVLTKQQASGDAVGAGGGTAMMRTRKGNAGR